jgi:type II secretion system protein H
MKRAAGFTLIELMVVIAIIAIATSALMMRGGGGEEPLARLRLLLEAAAERAEIGGTPIAVDFEPGGYRFRQLDTRGQWLPVTGDAALARPRLEPDLHWRSLEVAGVAVPLRLVFAGQMPDFVLRVGDASREAQIVGRPNGRVDLLAGSENRS